MLPPSKFPAFVTLPAVLLAGLALTTGCDAPDRATGPEAAPDGPAPDARASMHAATRMELAGVREATAPYQDVAAAEADGYAQFSPHVPGMGIHYLTSGAFDDNGNSTLDGTLDRSDPEILVYVDDAPESPERRLVAVEYAIPKQGGNPPQNAVDLFSGADAGDWHVHPSSHELPLPNSWTVHGECHYEGGIGVFLTEDPGGSFKLWIPAPPPASNGVVGSWSGTVEPDQCPTSLGGDPLPPLLVAHGKWWTLHAWVWMGNPEGVFHPTNPAVNP